MPNAFFPKNRFSLFSVICYLVLLIMIWNNKNEMSPFRIWAMAFLRHALYAPFRNKVSDKQVYGTEADDDGICSRTAKISLNYRNG